MFWIKTSPEPAPVARISKRHRDVQTRMNYYDDPKDGSPPPAVRVDKSVDAYLLPRTEAVEKDTARLTKDELAIL